MARHVFMVKCWSHDDGNYMWDPFGCYGKHEYNLDDGRVAIWKGLARGAVSY
jgi:hypothetical protein